jgi:hypothetical protein
MKYHASKTLEGVEKWLHAFLIFAEDEVSGQLHASVALLPWKSSPSDKSLDRPQSCSGSCGEEKNRYPYRDRTTIPQSHSLELSQYSNRDIQLSYLLQNR